MTQTKCEVGKQKSPQVFPSGLSQQRAKLWKPLESTAWQQAAHTTCLELGRLPLPVVHVRNAN